MTSRAAASTCRLVTLRPAGMASRSSSMAACLGPRDELVDRQVPGGRPAHEERARHVGAVALDPGAEVEEEHLTPSHGPLAGRAVGQRGPRTGQAGHVEGEALCAAGPHAPLQGQCQLVLADADADVRQRLAESRISHGAGCADALQSLQAP